MYARPRLQAAAAASSAATPHTEHLQHFVTVAVGSYTKAEEHCDCDMHDHRTCVVPVRTMYSQRPPTLPKATRAQHHSSTKKRWNACVRATQCTTQQLLYGTHKHSHRCAQTRTSLAVHNSPQASHDSDFNVQHNNTAQTTVLGAFEAQQDTRRTSVQSDCRCCQGWYLACFDLACSASICDDDKRYRRLNVRAQGSPSTVGDTHTLRLPDPLLPEHATPDQLSSHGSLMVA